MTRRGLLIGSVAALAEWLFEDGALARTKSEWTPEIERVARAVEAKYHLPHGIARAFNLQENSGRMTSAKPRVEPAYFDIGMHGYQVVLALSHAFLKAHPEIDVPLDLEREQEATSWGPFQLMGFNLRALGCEDEFLASVSVADHFEYWGQFFRGYLDRYGSLARAITMYNGPKAKASYTRNIVRSMKRFSY